MSSCVGTFYTVGRGYQPQPYPYYYPYNPYGPYGVVYRMNSPWHYRHHHR